jgi:O-antigen/teichoic acid export membrane protein
MLENTWRVRAAGAGFALAPILRQYVASGGTLLFSTVCQFTWFIILARAFGVSQFGTLMVILAITALAASLCGVGCNDSMLRRTARRREDYRAMLGHGLIMIGSTGLALSLVSTVVLAALVGASVGLAALALFSLTSIVLHTFVSFAEQAYIGRGDFLVANAVNAGFSLLRAASAVVACVLCGAATLDEWALWTTGAHVVAAVAVAWLLRGLGAPLWRVDRGELVLGFHFCTPNIVDALRANVDRIALGTVLPPAVVGSYAAASRTVTVSQIVVNSLNRIMYPRFSQRKAAGFAGVLHLAAVYVVALVALSGATAYALYLVAPLLPMLLGDSYRSVIFDLRVLCWLLVPLAVQTVPYDLFAAFDRHGLRAWVYNSVSLIGAAATALAIYSLHLTGAFVAIYAVQIALSTALWLLLLREARAEMRRSVPQRKAAIDS